MSERTIIRISSSNPVDGSQPSSRRAREASPVSRTTSAGREKRGSLVTYCSQPSIPASSKATSTHSRTVCACPVATTKSPGVSCWSMSHIAST